jgi:hypothetical protein
VVPQHGRRPRIIIDYSFFNVNNETVRLAPDKAMQFGKALERIIQNIVVADPKYGPVHLMKVDIADGFYRIQLCAPDIVKLAVSIPVLVGKEPLIALPLVLPMGWTESPPWFCAATESTTDVANHRLEQGWVAPPAPAGRNCRNSTGCACRDATCDRHQSQGATPSDPSPQISGQAT